MQDAAAMRRVIDIARTSEHSVIVSSACSGVTDKLLQLIDLAGKGEAAESYKMIDLLAIRHESIAKELIHSEDLLDKTLRRLAFMFQELRTLCEGAGLLGETTSKTIDAAASYGELLSTTILFGALLESGFDTAFLDARSIIVTDSAFGSANVDFAAVSNNVRDVLQPLLAEKQLVVTQGFIGMDALGRTTTLGRGGSDYSAAIFGAALGADEIQIWTDVDGVLSADPRKIKNAAAVPEMTFDEIRLLAFWGAKVLHPDTILPAVESGIPVKILNTYNPGHRGTTIFGEANKLHPKIHSIALKKDFLLMRYESTLYSDSEISDKISKFGGRIFCNAGSDTKKIIVAGDLPDLTNSASKFEKSGVNVEIVSCLCISGQRIPELPVEKLQTLSEILQCNSSKFIIWGISDMMILAFFSESMAENALNEIHMNLVEQS